MSDSSQARFHRRSVLTAAAAAAGIAALQACAPAASPTAVPAKPAEPAKVAPTAAAAAPATVASAPAKAENKPAQPATAPKPGAAATARIYTLVDKVWSDLGMLDATLRFNEENKDLTPVTLEETAQGWETKVLAQIKDKNLRWSAHGYTAFFDSYKIIKSGMAAPIDDYLKASKFAWGRKQKDAYFTPRIYDALTFEGKQYFIPMKANVHLVGYRSDYLQMAGYETFPKTWDETEKMMVKLKPLVEKDGVTVLGIARETFRTVGTMFTTFIEKPFDDNGVLKFDSPEFIQVIELLKKWKDAGLARVDTTGDMYDVWQKGKIVYSLGSHSFVRVGRQVWGTAKVRGANPPQSNASSPQRTWIHIDSAFLLQNAPNPQGAMDWILSILGPEGAPAQRWWNGVLTFSGQPVHQSWIDNALKPNKELSDVYDVMALVGNSQIITTPVAGAYAIVDAKMWPYLDRVFKGELSAKDAMASTRKEVDEELKKQQLLK